MSTNSTSKSVNQKDVPLGPACLVVFIFLAVSLSVFVIYISSMMMGNQGKRAAMSVREQIIPWVEQSSLSGTDRTAIIERLGTLASSMDREELTSRQLSRLVMRLTDSPVLQWGVVEQLAGRAKASEGLTVKEREEFSAECDRWFRAAADGTLSLQDMEFALQNVATKEPKTGRLSPKGTVTDDMLREFIRRATAISDKLKTSKAPFDKSVAQVFMNVIEDGLKEE
jgi:hypothetical protein